MKTVSLIIFLFLSLSCAVPPSEKNYRIDILLSPGYPVTIGLNDSKPSQAQFIDNDGNMYITYWDISIEGYDQFSDDARGCRELLRSERLFVKRSSIHDYNVSDISPSLNEKYAQCLDGKGYSYLSIEAYVPDHFRLSLSRSHTSGEDYMPVGSRYYLTKEKAQYIDIYHAVLACDNEVLSSGYVTEEKFGYDYRRVSIEKYANELESCIQKKGINVEKP